MEPIGDFWVGDDSRTALVRPKKVFTVNGATRAALVVNNGIAGNVGCRSDMFVANLDENVDGNSRAKATQNRTFAKTGDENASKEAVAHWDPIE